MKRTEERGLKGVLRDEISAPLLTFFFFKLSADERDERAAWKENARMREIAILPILRGKDPPVAL